MKKIITEYVEYNLWANTQFANYFRLMNEDLFTKHIESSFPSLEKTVLHLWGVEDVWLERIKGNSPQKFVSDGFKGAHDDLLNNWLRVSQDFLDFVKDQSEDYFKTEIEIVSHISGKFNDTPFNYAFHCCNHSTMHRGQLYTMCRSLGIEGALPRTDLIFYRRLILSDK